MTKQYWLIKSEPDEYSVDDLREQGQCAWEGVRNYQARNFMRDSMKVGDLALFYHSNAKPPGVAGVAKVASKPYPDPTQFDSAGDYHDPKATLEAPRWFLVDFAFVEQFADLVPLDEIKAHQDLTDMLVTRRGIRLSIQPVDADHFKTVVRLGRAKGKASSRKS